MTRLEVLQQAAEGQATKIKENGKMILLDMTTANAMLTVYNALNDTNKAKFLGLNWLKAVDVTWRLVK